MTRSKTDRWPHILLLAVVSTLAAVAALVSAQGPYDVVLRGGRVLDPESGVSDLQPRYRVCAIAMRQPTLERMPATVKEAHESYHVECRADARLYHSAICAGARQRDWKVVFHRRGEELQRAADALKRSTNEVERLLVSLRPTLRPPWAAEHRLAFAAAMAALTEGSR